MKRTDDRGRRRESARFFGALALLKLVGACDDSGADGSSSGAAAGAPPSATSHQTGSSGAPSGGASSGAPSAAGAAGSSIAAAGSDSSGAPLGQAGSPGDSLLSPRQTRYHGATTDRSLHFELDVVDGLSPYPSSLEYLGPFVSRVLDKPDGIFFDQDETLPSLGDDHVWTFAALDEFARAHVSDDTRGPVSIHVLFVEGRYDSGDDSGTVLGLAWGERHIALFQDAIRSGCSGVLGPLQADTCELAERSVWAHEIGHVIGLVDNGLTSETDHRDPDHGRHDVSDECLMFWAYESPAAFDILVSRLETGQSPDVDFCENCWADLRRARP